MIYDKTILDSKILSDIVIFLPIYQIKMDTENY